MGKTRFQKLLEPSWIGSMSVRNRLVMPPMATNFGSREGLVTQRMIDYYEQRAKFAGLVIVEFTGVDSPVGRATPQQLLIDDDKFIPDLGKLAQAIKRQGARAAIQLHHVGRQAKSSVTGHQPVAPSSIPAPEGELPRELTPSEIATIVARFGEGAERAKRAGFDGVEIHGAHGYLISQFLSPLSNHRKDAYGGDVENRARMLLEVIHAIRERVGKDYPVWCRLSAREIGVEGGITLEETQIVAQLAEKAGVDAIHVSAHPVGPGRRPPMAQPPCAFVPLAEGIKKVVSVPVIAVSRIPPELGESVLQEGKVDFIAIGRGLLADPHMLEKVTSGREEDVAPCICCMTCLDSVRWREEGIWCVVNPALGKERECELKLAEKPKKVVVVGGGPGGMEAARVASLRGHKVILFDDGDELGGQLLVASKPPFKETIDTFRQYLAGQVAKLGVELRLGERFTAELLDELKPDVVVLATGVIPFVPQIPGIEGKQVLLASEVLSGAETGERVAVIGGELVGCETAVYLVQQGKSVTIMRRGPELATNVNPLIRGPLIGRLKTKGASILTGVQYEEITEAGVTVRTETGERRTVEADTVVLAAGAKPNTDLLTSVEGKVAQVFCVGDCVKPRGIREAVEEGYRAGLIL
jgi:2,4-dienoyl-CoA reductase-like NADH-dependent reductase (Old Yellow Enzyme family)/thioredoxin reductase